MNSYQRRFGQSSLLWLLLATVSSTPVDFVSAEDPLVKPQPVEPTIAEASPAAERALQGFVVVEGLRGSVFAAEPLVANPVAFCLDERGRVYVCESFRQNAGVTDNRGHDEAWLNDDLAAQTVEDRIAYHRKHLGEKVAEYTRNDDRIRLLTDEDGDGRADRATVFADHFNGLEEGTGAGVLAHRGKVYFTCIPNLWQLVDTNNDGRADERTVLHTGYGVRVAFRGHDLHGLTIGPDRRLYFSVGDRGYHIVTPDGRLADPESGAVFRCQLDGSQLEVYATGLRNPQELAFDDFGNLFTGDNNSDSGDKARWVYVVPGGDTGWRMSYQYLPDRGPFNREKIWHPFHANQPAYIVPPIANFADGPSGLAYYPGVGLPESFRGRFFLCDFRGGAANSGIRTFRVKPRGAFFEIADAEQPIWQILATDVDFGPDGSIYVSDWVDGWNGEGKGRIYRFESPAHQSDPLAASTKKLLTEGVQKQSANELVHLLGHPDRRVRLAAQFELSDRNDLQRLKDAAKSSENQYARLHAIWALGSATPVPAEFLVDLLGDADAEIRAQAAKVLGEARAVAATNQLAERLQDDSARVRYFAALALGRIGAESAVTPLAAMLAENSDQDPIVRHGGIMGLAGVQDSTLLAKLADHPSISVRLAAVVALRKQRHPLISRFLKDSEQRVVVEAARAIHDVPIETELAKLAECLELKINDDAFLRRVLNANYRLGGAEQAARLVRFAADAERPEPARIEALQMLAEWSRPGPRDRVLGMWRPIAERDQKQAQDALAAGFEKTASSSSAVRRVAAIVAGRMGIAAAEPVLKGLFQDRRRAAKQRAEALLALDAVDAEQAKSFVEAALADSDSEMRAAGRSLLLKHDPSRAVQELERAARGSEKAERQEAVAQLADLPQSDAAVALRRLLDGVRSDKIPADTRLDVLLAVEKRSEPELQRQLKEFESKRDKSKPLALFQETLVGGDSERGRTIFFERTEASCVRCHKVRGRGGEVGPDLSRVASDKSREYLLEAIVDPNRTIAKGFESVTIADSDGKVHVGVVKHEDPERIQIITADAKTVSIDKDNIEDRQPAKSPMPEDVSQKLSKADIRDLIEFLAGLR